MRPSFHPTVQNLQPASSLSGTWYRAIQTQFLSTALATHHTITISSRFSAASRANPGHPILYLAEDHQVALLEVQALLGSPTTPGGLVARPRGTWVTLPVQIALSRVADLSDVACQRQLEITAQELTGDWRGYRLRGPHTTVSKPTGPAPTQELGAAMHHCARFEGFTTLSAKAPDRRILVFPDRLRRRSRVTWDNPTSGQTESLPSPG